jgi:hypothetical protein
MSASPRIPDRESEASLLQPGMSHPFFPHAKAGKRRRVVCRDIVAGLLQIRGRSRRPPESERHAGGSWSSGAGCKFIGRRQSQAPSRHQSPSRRARYCGTEATNIQDLLSDAAFALENWVKGGRAQEGFSDAIHLWPAVVLVLERAAGPIHFTGYSLGPAIAPLASSL